MQDLSLFYLLVDFYGQQNQSSKNRDMLLQKIIQEMALDSFGSKSFVSLLTRCSYDFPLLPPFIEVFESLLVDDKSKKIDRSARFLIKSVIYFLKYDIDVIDFSTIIASLPMPLNQNDSLSKLSSLDVFCFWYSLIDVLRLDILLRDLNPFSCCLMDQSIISVFVNNHQPMILFESSDHFGLIQWLNQFSSILRLLNESESNQQKYFIQISSSFSDKQTNVVVSDPLLKLNPIDFSKIQLIHKDKDYRLVSLKNLDSSNFFVLISLLNRHQIDHHIVNSSSILIPFSQITQFADLLTVFDVSIHQSI